jgi:hypothetical protein
MSLQSWLKYGWLRPHRTNNKEIADLFRIIDRDLKDAAGDISDDWRFGIAYNAALKLCTILIYAEGFRPERALQHYRTIQALPIVLGDKRKADADYLDSCRSKRNTVEYDSVGAATGDDARELIEFAKDLKASVLSWLKEKHPELL